MTRFAISTGSKFEIQAGYSRAVVDGEWVFISGTAGYVPGTTDIADDVADQARQSLTTIAETLAKAGAGIKDIVSVRVYVSDRAHVLPVSLVLGENFSDPRPTNTTIVCGFVNDEIKVEIEAVARRQ